MAVRFGFYQFFTIFQISKYFSLSITEETKFVEMLGASKLVS
jgi:hypothetical protein